MTLADRNWKNIMHYGNAGLTGNFFQKVKEISSDYNYSPGDGILAVDTTDGEVIVTLPFANQWVVNESRFVIPIMHIAGSNNVKIKLSGSEVFPLGNTYFNLGATPFTFDFYVVNTDTLSAYGILQDLRIRAVASYTGTWAHTSWAALAILPFNTEREADQGELLLYQNYLTGTIADASDPGDGTVLFGDAAHGLIVGDVVTIVSTTNYNDTYAVVAVPDEDHFSITETFVADESGSWTRYPRYTILGDSEYSLSFSIKTSSIFDF